MPAPLASSLSPATMQRHVCLHKSDRVDATYAVNGPAGQGSGLQDVPPLIAAAGERLSRSHSTRLHALLCQPLTC